MEFYIFGSSRTTGINYGSSTEKNFMNYSDPQEAEILSWVQWECEDKKVPFAPLANNTKTPDKYMEIAKLAGDKGEPPWWYHWQDQVKEKVNEGFERTLNYALRHEISKVNINILVLQGSRSCEKEYSSLTKLASEVMNGDNSIYPIDKFLPNVSLTVKVKKFNWGWFYSCDKCGGEQIIPYGGDLTPTGKTWACHAINGCASNHYTYWSYIGMCPAIPDQRSIY